MGASRRGEFPGQRGKFTPTSTGRSVPLLRCVPTPVRLPRRFPQVSPVSLALGPPSPVPGGWRWGWGHARRRQPRAKCPGPESLVSRAPLGGLHVPPALRRCGAGDPLGDPAPGCSRGGVWRSWPRPEGRRRLSAVLRAGPGPPSARTMGSGRPGMQMRGGRGPPASSDKSSGRGAAREPLPAGSPVRPGPTPARAARRLRVRMRRSGAAGRRGAPRAPPPGPSSGRPRLRPRPALAS